MLYKSSPLVTYRLFTQVINWGTHWLICKTQPSSRCLVIYLGWTALVIGKAFRLSIWVIMANSQWILTSCFDPLYQFVFVPSSLCNLLFFFFQFKDYYQKSYSTQGLIVLLHKWEELYCLKCIPGNAKHYSRCVLFTSMLDFLKAWPTKRAMG